MKLKPGQTVYHGGKKYVGNVPDEVAEKVSLKKKKVEKPKTDK